MYIYNVTTNVEESIVQEWINWMKNIHIPMMISAGGFTSVKLIKVLVEEEMGGKTYSVQYVSPSKERLDDFLSNYADELNYKPFETFGSKVLTFATQLKVIETFE